MFISGGPNKSSAVFAVGHLGSQRFWIGDFDQHSSKYSAQWSYYKKNKTWFILGLISEPTMANLISRRLKHDLGLVSEPTMANFHEIGPFEKCFNTCINENNFCWYAGRMGLDK